MAEVAPSRTRNPRTVRIIAIFVLIGPPIGGLLCFLAIVIVGAIFNSQPPSIPPAPGAINPNVRDPVGELFVVGLLSLLYSYPAGIAPALTAGIALAVREGYGKVTGSGLAAFIGFAIGIVWLMVLPLLFRGFVWLYLLPHLGIAFVLASAVATVVCWKLYRVSVA